MKIIQEFKAFALKGNVLDLAVGVIIGGAFGKIVSSLVNDLIMPPFGVLLQGIDFKNLKWVLRQNADGTVAASVNYGSFLQNFVEFLIIGSAIFLFVKGLTRVQKKFREKEQAAPPASPAEDIQLLREIRDLLKKRVD